MFTDSTPYFSVTHAFEVFLETWPAERPLPTEAQLHHLLPTGMQLLSDVKALEADCLLQLRHLDDESKTIIDYLKLQSRKIDLVLQHVLAQAPHSGDAFEGIRFGGSGFQILSRSPFSKTAQFKATLYIKEELISIMCFAKVLHSHSVEQTTLVDGTSDIDTQTFSKQALNKEALNEETSLSDDPTSSYLTEFSFNMIQDSDIEQLVKASLNIQQKQLKLRKLGL
ncbi:hypothetical protein [uncultured Shewanella sp.]|uniref:hypothetical protein n=1 Tax=uncultured Shewanella sp. TaxID=173975 RepID=UPI0026097BDD|nr:hypothetical protein [uncultured Shewanella sp.]